MIPIPAGSEAGKLIYDICKLKVAFLEPGINPHKADYVVHQAGKKAFELVQLLELVVTP